MQIGKRSAIILAGGEGKRVNRREKYMFTYQGKSFISRLVSALTDVVDEIIIVARSHDQAQRFSDFKDVAKCCWDKTIGLGPIGGIISGIEYIPSDSVFIVACDMPSINPEVIEYLFNNLGSYDAVIPEWENKEIEPLHAVYRVSSVQRYLDTHIEPSLRGMINSINTKRIHVDELRLLDPNLETFRNINTLTELAELGSETSYIGLSPKNE